MQITETTPYHELPPREQVFRLEYWGMPRPEEDMNAPSAPTRVGAKLSREQRQDLGKIAIDVIDGRRPVTWVTRPEAQLMPIPSGSTSPYHQPGALIIYDLETLHSATEKRGSIGWEKAIKKSAMSTDASHALCLEDADPLLLDAIVANSPIRALQAANSKPDPLFDTVTRRNGTTYNNIYSRDKNRIYTRAVRLGYIGLRREKPILCRVGGANDMGSGIMSQSEVFNILIKDVTTSKDKHNDTRALSRLRTLGICYAPATAPSFEWAPGTQFNLG